MTSYPYIQDLFQGILNNSKAIEGRFHVSYRYGAQEINSDKLGEIIRDSAPAPKYPLSLWMPPHSTVPISEPQKEWERYRIILFFVKTSYFDATGTANQNPNTRTSMHTVQMDWQDMKRCAINFLRALRSVQMTERVFRLPPNQVLVVPISKIGTDGTTGVRIDFDFDVFLGCDVEDYSEYPTTLNISLDSHPEHKM